MSLPRENLQPNREQSRKLHIPTTGWKNGEDNSVLYIIIWNN